MSSSQGKRSDWEAVAKARAGPRTQLLVQHHPRKSECKIERTTGVHQFHHRLERTCPRSPFRGESVPELSTANPPPAASGSSSPPLELPPVRAACRWGGSSELGGDSRACVHKKGSRQYGLFALAGWRETANAELPCRCSSCVLISTSKPALPIHLQNSPCLSPWRCAPLPCRSQCRKPLSR